MNTIYLHGFASGPRSAKARLFQALFQKHHAKLVIPDLNLPDFTSLTVGRQLEQVEALMRGMKGPVRLIGSSMGGYVATLLAHRNERVDSLLLMAPAFSFLQRQERLLGKEGLSHWRSAGWIDVDHHATGKKERLSFGIVEEAQSYKRVHLGKPIPTLIFHGVFDTVVPYGESIRYLRKNPLARLKLLPSDHSLLDMGEEIIQESAGFLF